MSLRVPNVLASVIVTAVIALFLIIPSCAKTNAVDNSGTLRRVFPTAVEVSPMPLENAGEYPRLFKVQGPSGVIGYSIEQKVVSRSGPFTIRVLLDPQLYVKEVSVLSYPGARGRQVRSATFAQQFYGKGPEDPIRIGQDIHAVTGATLSSVAMTKGVRKSIALARKRAVAPK